MTRHQDRRHCGHTGNKNVPNGVDAGIRTQLKSLEARVYGKPTHESRPGANTG